MQLGLVLELGLVIVLGLVLIGLFCEIVLLLFEDGAFVALHINGHRHLHEHFLLDNPRSALVLLRFFTIF